MSTIVRYTAAFLIAVACASLLASLFSTQSVIASLQGIGAEISFRTRMDMTLGDFKILQSLAPIIATCFLIGFLVAAMCNKFFIANRNLWFVAAGGCAFIAALLLLSWFFQLMPIAGARTVFGLACQALAGAVGGYVFSKFTASIHSKG